MSASGRKLPSARLASTGTIGRDSEPSQEVSVLLMSFGQFVDHDLTHVPIQNNGGERDRGGKQATFFQQIIFAFVTWKGLALFLRCT